MTTQTLSPAVARRAPWDVMGTDLKPAQTTSLDKALAATGLDYEVRLETAAAVDRPNGPLVAPNFRAIVRPWGDGERVLGFSGKRFTPIHNRDAFSVGGYLVSEFDAKIRALTDFRNGAQSLLVVDLDKPVVLTRRDGQEDRVDLDLLIKNAHDGSAALTFALTGVRIACTNAVHAAIAGAERTWKFSHTPRAADRMALAHQAILNAVTYQGRLQAVAQSMIDQDMVDAEFSKIVQRLWPVKAGATGIQAERRRAIQQDVEALYRNSETLEGIRGTRWGGYNAVTEWMNHARPVKGADASAQAISRAEGNLEGPNVRQMAKVWGMFAGAAA
jgi:phage/plasmid-like protein (TIGR03299 family)